MKHNYQHIFKKTYAKPVIEEVMIDREMSLAMTSPETPPLCESGDCGEEGEMPDYSGGAQSVNYGPSDYHSPSTPFGDNSSPSY